MSVTWDQWQPELVLLLLIPDPVFTQASRVDVLRGFHNRIWDQLLYRMALECPAIV